MPTFEKSPPELVARFDAVAASHPAAQRRSMFGHPALFIGGNYATGLFAHRWLVRLGAADVADALALEGAGPFSPMPDRAPMTGWVMLPDSVVADDAALDAWLSRALEFAASLPAKA